MELQCYNNEFNKIISLAITNCYEIVSNEQMKFFQNVIDYINKIEIFEAINFFQKIIEVYTIS